MSSSLDDHMEPVWEEAFRDHLRLRAGTGDLPVHDVVAIGRWWSTDGRNEIDAVALAGRSRTPVLVGEAKWTRKLNGGTITHQLAAKAEAGLGVTEGELTYAICARREVSVLPAGALAITANDIFPPRR